VVEINKDRKKPLRPDLSVVAEQERIARSMTPQFTIVKLREKNKATFTQTINDNAHLLLTEGYLTDQEYAFIDKIKSQVEMHSNAIVEHIIVKHSAIHKERYSTGRFLNVTQIAKLLGITRQTASEIISSLLKKGILYEISDPDQLKAFGRVVTQRVLFANPEIIFAGDRNRINATLCRMVMGADKIEKAGIRLIWKVWLKEGAEYGRLYKYSTYWRLKHAKTSN